MKYIIAQEGDTYGAWQCQTAVKSLVDLGVELSDIYILLGNVGYNKHWKEFEVIYRGINIHKYRAHYTRSYIAAVKPYLLWKFFEQFPSMESEKWFLMDNDVVLTKLIDVPSDKVYLSDCKSYVGMRYLREKGEGLIENLANHVNINLTLLEDNDEGAGGAQYVFGDIKADTWKRAYTMSVQIHSWLKRHRFKPLEGNPIQVWCSEMWGVLWAIWEAGHKTEIIRSMDFAFSTDNVSRASEVSILHNAGVTDSTDERFLYKGAYTRKYPPKDLELDDTKVSWMYYEYVKRAI